jgi:hypothetical protein
MSKRNGASPQNVMSWIANGDGQGESKDYKPFFHVRDVPSQGRSAIDLGLKTGRSHHYLSDLEYAYHVMAEYSTAVIDIREQYALLPWEETQLIAQELGISHPIYPGTATPIVLTTDIVLTMSPLSQFHTIALSIKMANEIAIENKTAKRTLEKLLIEKKYWERRSIPWILCTEKELPANRAYNLDFFRNSMVRSELDCLSQYLPAFVIKFGELWKPFITLTQLLTEFSLAFSISKDEAFTLLGRAIWMRLIEVDLDSVRFDHNRPIPVTTEFNSQRELSNVE